MFANGDIPTITHEGEPYIHLGHMIGHMFNVLDGIGEKMDEAWAAGDTVGVDNFQMMGDTIHVIVTELLDVYKKSIGMGV